MQYDTIQYIATQNNTIQYNTIGYDTMQYNQYKNQTKVGGFFYIYYGGARRSCWVSSPGSFATTLTSTTTLTTTTLTTFITRLARVSVSFHTT